MDSFLYNVEAFITFGSQHMWAMVSSLILLLIFIWSAKKYFSERQQWIFGLVISTLPFLAYLIRVILVVQLEGALIQEELPLHICRVVSIFLPIMIFLKHRKMFAILYFWIMAGTTNAVLTPDLQEAFPHYSAWSYFIMHCGEIVVVLYSLFIFKFKMYGFNL